MTTTDTPLSQQLAAEWLAIDPAAHFPCWNCKKDIVLAAMPVPTTDCPFCGFKPDDDVSRAGLEGLADRRQRAQAAATTETVEAPAEAPRCDPPGLADFIGNSHAVLQVRTALDAHKERLKLDPKHVFPHTLIVGNAGGGKTTLAGIIARECGHKLHEQLGQSLNDPRAMVAALCELKAGDIFYIDEIHGAKRSVIETLYKALEERRVMPISSRNGPTPVPIKLPPFTIICSTTDEYKLSDSFKQRFQYHIHMKRLTVPELAGAIVQRAERHGWKLDAEGAALIASRSHGIPRKAVMLLTCCMDTALAGKAELIDAFIVERTCEINELDALGLTAPARQYLHVLRDAAKPVRLNILSSTLGLPPRVCEIEIERDLIWLGLISKPENGRALSDLGRAHLKGN